MPDELAFAEKRDALMDHFYAEFRTQWIETEKEIAALDDGELVDSMRENWEHFLEMRHMNKVSHAIGSHSKDEFLRLQVEQMRVTSALDVWKSIASRLRLEMRLSRVEATVDGLQQGMATQATSDTTSEVESLKRQLADLQNKTRALESTIDSLTSTLNQVVRTVNQL